MGGFPLQSGGGDGAGPITRAFFEAPEPGFPYATVPPFAFAATTGGGGGFFEPAPANGFSVGTNAGALAYI